MDASGSLETLENILANVYDGVMSVGVSLEDVQRIGLPMGGEPLVALDLADTLMLAQDPETDLLASPELSEAWWTLEMSRLPESPRPEQAAARRLRAAIRDLLDSHLEQRSPLETSIEDVNAASASVPTSPRLARAERRGPTQDSPWHGDSTWHGETRWHREHGGNAALAAIARETIELFSSPERLSRLRRCADPTCSMLFLAETTRRQWCASNLCGNRNRVARHYRRTHPVKGGET